MHVFMVGACQKQSGHNQKNETDLTKGIYPHEELNEINIPSGITERNAIEILQSHGWKIHENSREQELAFRGISQYQLVRYTLPRYEWLELLLDSSDQLVSLSIKRDSTVWERVVAPYPNLETLSKVALKWENLEDGIALKSAFEELGLRDNQAFLDLAYSEDSLGEIPIVDYLWSIPDCEFKMVVKEINGEVILEYSYSKPRQSLVIKVGLGESSYMMGW